MILAAMRRRRLSRHAILKDRGMRRALRSRKALLVALLTVAALALPAVAAAKPVLAVGDQKPSMFADPRFRWLSIRHSRLVVSWRVEQTKWERELGRRVAGRRQARRRATRWSPSATSWGGKRRAELPSVKEYTRAVADFRKRYPWVRDYTPWNEANHCSQPTCHHPARAAAYYDVLRARARAAPSSPPTCSTSATWSRGCARSAATPRATRASGACTTTSTSTACAPPGTKHLLKAVQGTIWITETGGIVRRDALQAADRRLRGVARARRDGHGLDPAAGQPLPPGRPRLPLPVERRTRRRRSGTRA